MPGIIEKLRGKKTQRELGRELGVSQRAVAYYESGQRVPRPAVLRRLIELYPEAENELLKLSLKGK